MAIQNLTETKILIVGAGPAGASLAAFLSSHGITGIMISSSPGTADTPRAHVTSAATMECLRDIGLEDNAVRLGNAGENISYVRWCESMAGSEIGRVYAFGKGPQRKGEYEAASPCQHIDLPQTLMEPLLVQYATTHGFQVRFSTTLLRFVEEEESNTIVAHLRDELTGTEYSIRTKYLFGADGARSQVVRQLGIPLIKKGSRATMINVLVKADLSHIMSHRKGDLHWVYQPHRAPDEFGPMAIGRMVHPWTEWIFIVMPSPEYDDDEKIKAIPKEVYQKRVQELIGDDTPVEVLHIGPWHVNETYAEKLSQGRNIFCLGDAVHRHPPTRGLGSNTCIQDAFSLAWKVAYVEKGLASPSLLDSYSAERQPVGKGIVTDANDALRAHPALWEALGTVPPKPDVLAELASATPEGKARRSRVKAGLESVQREVNGLGTEMGQTYLSSAVYTADEKAPFAPSERVAKDPVLYYDITTYPGRRLPHVWLNDSAPEKPAVSTIDLAGHGVFTLFTGIDGAAAWKEAAEKVGKELGGVEIRAYSIGFRQDWEDVFRCWEDARGVDESGAVLVRPDRFVAWRADKLPEGGAEAAKDKLGDVMKAVLGFNVE